ncbi:hypothetical protein C8R42DRAFT_720696 [Lentinula raphanica]|nr:hypothetical protein C8R42DRAFT_720696 [Lentinula raphanica]
MRREDKDRYRGVAEGAMIKHPPLWDHSDSLSSTLISTPVSNTAATADAQHALFYTLPPTISPLSSYRLPPALPSTVSPLSSYRLPPALPLTPLPLPMPQTLFLLPSSSRSSSSCAVPFRLPSHAHVRGHRQTPSLLFFLLLFLLIISRARDRSGLGLRFICPRPLPV